MSDFWTRRKAAVKAQERDEALAIESRAQEEREVELSERSDEDILAELDLPDPDHLQQGDDFKAFLTEAVPARIRTRALRRLWRVNPILANVDGLVDYGEDFNDASFVIENMQTAYQVGKGMTEHVKELARKLEELGGEEEVTPEGAPETEHESVRLPTASSGPEMAQELPQDAPTIPTIDVTEDTPVAPPSRRMRFTFDPQTQAPSDAARI